MKVVILAGGLGTRLSEETQKKPKPMVKIGNLPILVHIINYYKKFGLNEFIICCGYKNEVITNFFKKEYRLNRKQIKIINSKTTEISSNFNDEKILLINTGMNTGTGGRLKKIVKLIKENFFLMTYGDGLSNVNIKKLINYHIKCNRLVTLTAVFPPPRWGYLNIKGTKVTNILEKVSNYGNRVNGGFFVINKSAIKFIKNYSDHWEQQPLSKIAELNQLTAYKHNDFWQPMDTLREKNILNDLIKQKKAPWLYEDK
tara:strand:+ start:335 stop:1105 length:771 start_codon:yes stop_codon:yes gene_type:complete